MRIFGKPSETKPGEVKPSPAAPPAATTLPATARPSCVIGAKTTIKGEITGDEDVLVDGTVEGQIRITRDLRVGSSGCVRASVEAQSIVVSGELAGDCIATGRVEIQATGRLTGNIRAPKIVIAEGAMFKGNSDMSGRRENLGKEREKAAAS